MAAELTFEKCTRACPEINFDCKSTAELAPLEEIIGQGRAVRALQFGLNIQDKGFNIFVSGPPGTGRKTAIVDFVKELARSRPVPPDWCYVNNFKDPSKPRAISLPAGQGMEFKKAMERFVTSVTRALREAFESDDYTKRRTAVLKVIEDQKVQIANNINQMARDSGFLLQQSPIGLILVPLVKGRPLKDEEFAELPPALQKEITTRRDALQAKLFEEFRPLRELDRKAEEEVVKLNKSVATFAMEPFAAVIKERFGTNEEVLTYMAEVEDDILQNLPRLLVGEQQAPQMPFGIPPPNPSLSYQVNLIVDNSSLHGAPAEIELTPSHYRLFGFTEREARFGALVTDYTMIRAGSAHKANGGFLVIPADRMFIDPIVWESLKQTISNAKLEIEEPAARLGYIVTKSLRPEPIPFDAKVIIIGDPHIFDVLYSMDRDFKELFKVKAEFDNVMDRNEENIGKYAAFVCALCNKEGLLHYDPTGMAAIIDYSSRLVEDQAKLSTQFADVADIVRESAYYATQEGANLVTRKHVQRQLEEKVYRSNMIQKKVEEMIARDVLMIDTEGEKVGQVNGLAVLSVGDYAFGRPSKITASIGVGREGVIDIERQAQMSGPTHTKGVLILSGYLNNMYAGEKPLSLAARLVFEQSYSGVDGDSASSTELYAMLSALSGKPVKQYLAITGSVNQNGDVQAIGGVNEKVEGFFEVCKAKGLTGRQGCVIPQSNVQNLMLKQEVLDAIKGGQFHLYPVKSISEGIETLTGVKAGARLPQGGYEEGTINDLVQKRLSDMAERVKEYRA